MFQTVIENVCSCDIARLVGAINTTLEELAHVTYESIKASTED